MNKVVTANWARAEVKGRLSAKINDELAKCEKAIREAIQVPECKAFVEGQLSRFASAELNARGFNLLVCHIDGVEKTKISW